MPKKRIGILTGGGPAPGLNATIYGAAKAAFDQNWDVLGIKRGWKGILTGEVMELKPSRIRGIYTLPGTILKTSRTNLAKVKPKGSTEEEDKTAEVASFMNAHELTGLFAIGGEDTISVADQIFKQYQVPVVCAPKTIDGDVCGTDRTFGLDTAANWVGNAIAGLQADFESTGYIAVVEVMGRKAGWLTLFGGLKGGAHLILIPELTYDMDEIITNVKRVYDELGYCIVAVAEELKIPHIAHHILVAESTRLDSFGHDPIALREKGWARVVAEKIAERTGITCRPIVLGHAQRGGAPSAFDVSMCLQLGRKAFDCIQAGIFGKLIAWQSERPVAVDLKVAGGGKFKPVPPEIYEPLLACLP